MHDRAGVTTVFVTHDQEEALDLADRVAILSAGRLIQLGAPQALYDAPASAFVYEFLGAACRLPAIVAGGYVRVGDWTAPAGLDAPVGPAQLYFRPGEIAFAPSGGVGLTAEVRGVYARGPDLRIDCRVAGAPIELVTAAGAAPPGLAAGGQLRFAPTRFKLYPPAAD
jgi:sulfate transport system ATP-binding protein